MAAKGLQVLYINEAKLEDLLPIHGIGEATAKHILHKREELGGFNEENFPIDFKNKQLEAHFLQLISQNSLSFDPKPFDVRMTEYMNSNAEQMQNIIAAQTKIATDLRNMLQDYQQQSTQQVTAITSTLDKLGKDMTDVTGCLDDIEIRLATIEMQQDEVEEDYQEPDQDIREPVLSEFELPPAVQRELQRDAVQHVVYNLPGDRKSVV